MGIFSGMDISFWAAQIFALIGMALMFLQTRQSDRRQFNLYHTYLCVPFFISWMILGGWFMASLCFVGGIRTFLLASDWGWARRQKLVFVCLAVPVLGGLYTAAHMMDYVLMFATVLYVSSEAGDKFVWQRVTHILCGMAWLLSSLTFGGYVFAVGELFILASCLQVLERDFGMLSRLYYVLAVYKFRLPALARAS